MPSKKYKAAIVGCGRVASLFANDRKRKGIFTHAQAYLAHPKVELIAACDTNPSRLSAFGKRWGVKRLYTDFTKLMREEKPDLVSICTWNSSHEPLLRTAVKYGASGVICEKPISDSLRSAQKMIRLCKAKRLPLLINYYRRYNKLHQKLKTMIQNGSLGEIQTVSCYYTSGIMNTGTHLFDLLRYFFGDVRWVWANPDRVLQAKDPTLDLYLFFKMGFGCSISALDVKKYMQFEIDIYGTRGRLRLEDSGMKATIWRKEEHTVYSGYKTLQRDRAFQTKLTNFSLATVNNLIACVEEKKKPICSGEDGKKSLEIACAGHMSLKQNRRVYLPLKNSDLRLESN